MNAPAPTAAAPPPAAATAEAPWLADPSLELAALLQASHLRAFGLPLVPRAQRSSRQLAQELFAAPLALLAHDGGDDPRLIYANRVALRLWRRSWGEMVGLPSRLTAEPSERPGRAQALATARSRRALRGYGGIRIDSRGRRFRLAGARIWDLGEGQGQGACFDDWWWL